MKKVSRVRKPQGTIEPRLYKRLQEIAAAEGTKIHTVTNEALELGMRMKRWLPVQETQTPN